jgi:hypothetical protein
MAADTLIADVNAEEPSEWEYEYHSDDYEVS